jgi:uncharacterized protein (TIGR03437 family)
MWFALLLAIFTPVFAQVSVTTYQYDNTRAGTNSNETILTPSNVNVTQFGQLFSDPIDGQAYAQPLYLPNVSISGATHNVVFIATENDSVYAFDADSKATLWHTTFLINGATTVPYTDVGCSQIAPQIGITGTPVIDPASGTIFVVAMTKESGNYVHRLHALDVTTGLEKLGSPVVIQASVPGTGDGGSTVTLIPKNYKQRPGLLLLNGVVYLGMSSHCDIGTYHGWLLGFNEQSLQQVAVYNDTPNGAMGSFWTGGAAPAADSAGYIYVVSGNGTFDAGSGGVDLGESYIKLNSSNMSVADYFTPFNYASLDAADLDTGSAGVALLGPEAGSAAHPNLMVGAGKEGRLYLIDRGDLGKWQSAGDAVVQSIPKAISGLFGNPAYFDQWAYFCGGDDQLRAYPVSNAIMGAPVVSQFTFTNFGCVPTISANGTSDAILWALDDDSHTLRAFEATNVANALWDSSQNSARDSIDSVVKFTAPMVVNGKVYVATNTALYAFGLLSPPAALTIANSASFATGSAAPGSLISIAGSALATSTASATGFPLPQSLGGASVTINGLPASLLYASATLINAQVPIETPAGPAMVTVNNNVSATLTIAAAAPGIFEIVPGQAAAVNLNGTVNGASNPVAAGGEIAVYVTGLGAVNPAVEDGAAASLTTLSYVNATVSATIGGQPANVIFAGLAPGYAGLYQVNVIVPQLAPGAYPIQFAVGGVLSNTASVSLQ